MNYFFKDSNEIQAYFGLPKLEDLSPRQKRQIVISYPTSKYEDIYRRFRPTAAEIKVAPLLVGINYRINK